MSDRKPMPSAMPAELAEKLSDRGEDERITEEREKRALDDLVDRLMRGEEYPPKAHRRYRTTRFDILVEQDAIDLAEILEQALRNKDSDWDKRVEEIVRAYFERKWRYWIEKRIAEMIEEECDG